MNERPPQTGYDSDPGEVNTSVELLRRARVGDRQALDRLFLRYVPGLRRWAHGRLPVWARDMLDTDDLVQDAMLKTMRNVEQFEYRHDGALQAYLREALRNRIRDAVRKAHRDPRVEAIRTSIHLQLVSPRTIT